MQDIYTKILTSKKFWKVFIPVILFTLVSGGLFLFKNTPEEVSAGWWNESWNYRKLITINKDYVTANLTDFPVLVSLTDSDFVGKAQSDGDDFVFTNYSGNEILKHEIESYASSTGTIVAWVKLPSISSTTDTLIQMYYGNASVGSQESVENVWGNDYLGVWHLSSDSTSSTSDSTKNNYNLSTVGTASSTATGQVGGGFLLDGNSDGLLTNSMDHNIGTGDFTWSAWVRPTNATDAWKALLDMNTRKPEMTIHNDATVDQWGMFWNGSSGPNGEGSGNTLSNDTWYYLVFQRDGTTIKFFQNNTQTASTYTFSDSMPNGPFHIGYDGNTNWTGGTVDEVRFSKEIKSLSWIQTEYNNQKNPSTFLTASAEEVGSGPVAYWSFDEGYGSTVYDESSGGNDGTITGATWQDESMCVSGKCLYFDGEDQTRIDANVQDNLEILTVCVWVKPTSFTNTDGDSLFSIASKDKWRMTYNVSGKLAFGRNSYGIYPSVESTENIKLNKWNHVCTVFEGVGVGAKIFINSKDVSNVIAVGSGNIHDDSYAELRIGSANNIYGDNVLGYIDEVKIYPYARTANQIKQDYNAGLAGIGTSKGTSASFGSKSDSWMSDGLVGYWKMDETATTSGAIDSSGNGNNGTYYGTASTTGGKFGNGGVFDGVDDYIDLGANIVKAKTLATWVYINDCSSYQKIISQATTPTYRQGIYVGFGEVGTFVDDNSGYDQRDVACTVGWHHLAMTNDGVNSESIRFFVDGVEYTTEFNTIGISTNQRTVIGADTDLSGEEFNGKVDEVRIYNRALSKDEVRKLYEWAPGPVLHLKMDEKEGTTAYDVSGQNNNGTISGATWTRGKYGSALDFDGVDDYISVSDDVSLEFKAGQSYTYGFWYRGDYNFSTANGFITKGYHDTTQNCPWNALGVGAGGAPFLSSRDSGCGNTEDAVATTDITDGEWYHIIAVRDSDNDEKRIYIDGILEMTIATLDYDEGVNSDNLVLMNHSNRFTEGIIDEVKIYNYARTQKQILEDMNGGHPAQKSPVAYWKFDEGYGSTVYDYSGNGNDGTVMASTSGSNTTATQMWDLGGKYDRAIEFDGVDDVISVPDNESLDISNNLFSLSVWIKVSTTSLGTIIDKGIPVAPYWSMAYNAYGTIGNVAVEIVSDSSGVSTHTKDLNINNNQWHQVGFLLDRRKNNGLKLFVDGEIVESYTTASMNPTLLGTSTLSNSGFLKFGNSFAPLIKAEFLIDEVKIFNYFLSEDEIKTEYNRGATQLGVKNIDSSGVVSNSANKDYCVPGDTATCNPPVLELKMDEKQGITAYDTSGNGNDGSFNNNPVWSRGKLGSGISFDGVDDYVRAGSGAEIDNMFSGGGTISAWVYAKSDGEGYGGRIADKSWSTEAGGGWSFGFDDWDNSNSYFRFARSFDGATSGIWWTDTELPLNSWQHVVVTYNEDSDSNDPIFYLNGKIWVSTEQAVPLGSAISDADRNLDIGGYGNSRAWDGILDDVRVYDYIRTPAQIAWDYNRGKPIAHYRFDECEGSTVYDWSGNENNGTISIGASGTQTGLGNCSTASTTTAWYNGRSGKVNESLNFDGTDDTVDLGVDTIGNLVEGSSQVTVSSWIKPSTIDGADSASNAFIAFEINTNNSYLISINPSTNVIRTGGRSQSTDSFQSVSGNLALQAGIWYHITSIYDYANDMIKIYVNGELDKMGAVSFGATSYTHTVASGADNFGDIYNTDRHYDGLLDEVKIYNYALTEEQIKMDYNNGAVRFGQ